MSENDAPARGASFEQRRHVVEADLDEQKHVNNVVYVRWVQEVATAHWQALAPPDVLAEFAWVARRHEIDYLAAALLGDELSVQTHVGHAEGLVFERLTEILRVSDGKLLARSKTFWIPVDARTGKVRRVSAVVRALASIDD